MRQMQSERVSERKEMEAISIAVRVISSWDGPLCYTKLRPVRKVSASPLRIDYHYHYGRERDILFHLFFYFFSSY